MGGSGIPVVDPISAQLGIGGGGGKGPEEPRSSRELAAIASQLFGETAPLRGELIGQSEAFLGGGLDVTQTPQFGALKQATEQLFDVARQRALGGVAEGGALTQALTDIEAARAGALTGGIGELAQQQQAQALGLATGTTGQALAGLGQAGGIQAQIAQAQAAQQAGMKGGLGQLAGGAAAGSKIAASDIRLKDNLKRVGELPNGIGLYTWEWNNLAKDLGIDAPNIGVVAQDVMQFIPDAVSEHEDGYLVVDYDKVSEDAKLH